MNPNVNYGLWAITVCQGRFVNSNKGSTLVGDIDNGRVYACTEAWEISIPSAEFCYESEIALKNSFFKQTKTTKR